MSATTTWTGWLLESKSAAKGQGGGGATGGRRNQAATVVMRKIAANAQGSRRILDPRPAVRESGPAPAATGSATASCPELRKRVVYAPLGISTTTNLPRPSPSKYSWSLRRNWRT